MRVRDIELLTKDVIRSTFKEDATKAILEKFGGSHHVLERTAIAPAYAEYPADIVLGTPGNEIKKTAIFLVNTSTQFVEAELLHAEIEKQSEQWHYSTVALIEDAEKLNTIGLRRIQRAINRGLSMPIFRGDEAAAMAAIGRISHVHSL